MKNVRFRATAVVSALMNGRIDGESAAVEIDAGCIDCETVVITIDELGIDGDDGRMTRDAARSDRDR